MKKCSKLSRKFLAPPQEFDHRDCFSFDHESNGIISSQIKRNLIVVTVFGIGKAFLWLHGPRLWIIMSSCFSDRNRKNICCCWGPTAVIFLRRIFLLNAHISVSETCWILFNTKSFNQCKKSKTFKCESLKSVSRINFNAEVSR